jgi:hypothetical protein
MDKLPVSSSPATRHSLSRRFLRFVLSLSLLLLAAAQASAQYGDGGGMTGTFVNLRSSNSASRQLNSTFVATGTRIDFRFLTSDVACRFSARL